jgi:hypothetical protein
MRSVVRRQLETRDAGASHSLELRRAAALVVVTTTSSTVVTPESSSLHALRARQFSLHVYEFSHSSQLPPGASLNKATLGQTAAIDVRVRCCRTTPDSHANESVCQASIWQIIQKQPRCTHRRLRKPHLLAAGRNSRWRPSRLALPSLVPQTLY